MKYVAGMVAGARAKADGNPKLGYIATFPFLKNCAWATRLRSALRKPARIVR